MGRKGNKKYRKEIRKEQREREKEALFWKLGKQLSDPLGEYRRFIANLRNKEINEVDDFIDIPINLVDLTANLITSLITGENCLYESINESDKRLAALNNTNEDSNTENGSMSEKTTSNRNNKNPNLKNETVNKRTRRKSKSHSRENTNNDDDSKEIKFTKFQPPSNSGSIKKNKSYSFNFEEYCHHENEESFYFIRKIIKKTQLSLTTFIVSLYFIYSYKHLEKRKRKHREHKVQKYISDWPMPSPKKSNRKKKRKRKNRNKNSESISTESSGIITDKGTPSSKENMDIKEEIQLDSKTIEIISSNRNQTNLYNSIKSPYSEVSSDLSIQNSTSLLSNSENDMTPSPILETEFLSTFQPRNQTSSNISKSSSTDSKLTLELYTNNTINSIINQYPSPSHSHTNTNDEDMNKNGKNDIKTNKNNNNPEDNENSEIKMNENGYELLNAKKKSKEYYNNNNNNNNSDDNDDDNKDDYSKEDEKNEEDDDSKEDEEIEEDDDDEEQRELLYHQYTHRRHNTQFNNILKNENLSKNFSYLSSCYILSDRYGSYVIPTFLASIIVADKLLYDATYTNLDWSEFTEGRYSLEDINELERRFLSIMNFQLFISQKKFDEFLSYLDFILCLQKIRAWGSIPFSLSYSDIYTLTKKIDTKYFNAYPNNKNINIYETLKFVFKIILAILSIYILIFFIYLIYKDRKVSFLQEKK